MHGLRACRTDVAGALERRGRLGRGSEDDRQEGVHVSRRMEDMVVQTVGREECRLSGESRFERVRTLTMSLQRVSVLRFWGILPIDNSGTGGQRR